MNTPVIQVSGLRKSFGDRTVLDDVSLDVPAGRTLALLGRNGCGKTTTIRMLLGLLAPDAGTLRIADCNPQREAVELRRRVGYLAEDQEMYPWMTSLELCRFLAPFYPDWDQKLADDLLDRFEVPRSTLIGRLSKGQAVELGLATALAHRPRLVILDDPTLGLDPIARKQFNRHLVEHLQAEGRTVLY
ncbi:MAG: ABC transporter ATP-binding protein, partial [Planctomycetaceae bacterium]|nr:ABC transporter ATP-binding protein [Planctomycetaceae bacterium]